MRNSILARWHDPLLFFLKSKGGTGLHSSDESPRKYATTTAYWQERKMRILDGPTISAWMFVVIGMILLFESYVEEIIISEKERKKQTFSIYECA